MDSRKKGNKRENQARGIYEDAGFAVEKAVPERYGRSDWFELFDFCAVRPDSFRFVQVKSESAEGVKEIAAWARENAPPWVDYEIAVVYDREGWRVVRILPRMDTYETLCDERKMDCNMGSGATEYLREH